MFIEIARRNTFRVEGPAGTAILVTRGKVWITRHHDTKDYLLAAGDVLEHTGEGKTLVTALQDADVQVLAPGHAA